MSETTELVRRVVREVLKDEPDVSSSLARSISSKIAGDPHLDRVDITADALEPVAHTVADATYRIDLDGFGVTDPNRARREIVEKTVQHFEVRSVEPDQFDEPGSENPTADEDDIIVAGSNSSRSDFEGEEHTDNVERQSPDPGLAAGTLTASDTDSPSERAPATGSGRTRDDGGEDDDIIVAEPDTMDVMQTAYDDEAGDIDGDTDDPTDSPTISW